MKTFLSLVLLLAVSSQVAVQADEGKVRAGVVTRTTVASLKLSPGKIHGARPTLEMGTVYEVVSATGTMPELKLDASRVAIIPPTLIKTRDCTTEELGAAQEKFNNTTFEAERKAVMAAYQTRLAALSKMTCATCPKVRAQAATRRQEAAKIRDDALREIERKKEALLNEAIAWVTAK